ncbi:hypothetical protein [Aestuariivivens sediminicola]|nr:hypothetical protein [Aestuariivivens sediminicola]
MYRNYEILNSSRETVNNNIDRYKLFGNSFRKSIFDRRRYRAI